MFTGSPHVPVSSFHVDVYRSNPPIPWSPSEEKVSFFPSSDSIGNTSLPGESRCSPMSSGADHTEPSVFETYKLRTPAASGAEKHRDWLPRKA